MGASSFLTQPWSWYVKPASRGPGRLQPPPSPFRAKEVGLAQSHTTTQGRASVHCPGGGAAQSGTGSYRGTASSLTPRASSEAFLTPSSRRAEEEPQAYEEVSPTADRKQSRYWNPFKKSQGDPWKLPAGTDFHRKEGWPRGQEVSSDGCASCPCQLT